MSVFNVRTAMDMMDAEKEKEQILVGAGREMADNLLESAVTDAKDTGQALNQMRVLYYCSIHMIAHTAFNDFKNIPEKMSRTTTNAWFQDFLMHTVRNLQVEFDNFQRLDAAGAVKKVNPGGKLN